MTKHEPMVVAALMLRECVLGGCDHNGKCPYRTTMVCGTCPIEEGPGGVALSAPWPCEHAPPRSRGAV